QLQGVGSELQQSLRPDPVGTDSRLHARCNSPFPPRGQPGEYRSKGREQNAHQKHSDEVQSLSERPGLRLVSEPVENKVVDQLFHQPYRSISGATTSKE